MKCKFYADVFSSAFIMVTGAVAIEALVIPPYYYLPLITPQCF